MLAPNGLAIETKPAGGWAGRIAGGTRRAVIEKFAIAALLVLAAFLRFQGIDKHCFWLDEVFTVQKAAGHATTVFAPPANRFLAGGYVATDPFNGSLVDVINALKTDTHPPLYTIVIRYWRQAFGTSDGATRSLSALCGTLAILLLWDAVRTLHGPIPAWWAALLMAVATPQIDYGQEARSYAMVTMWVAAALAATARIVRDGPGRRRQVALTLILLAGVATHYGFIAPLAAIMTFGFMQPQIIRRALWRCGLIALTIAVITIGPLLYAQHGTFQGDMKWAVEHDPSHVWYTLRRAACLPLQWFMTPMKSSLGWAILFSGVLLVPWLAVRRRPAMGLWLLATSFPLIYESINDLAAHLSTLEVIRYVLTGAVPAYALVACLLPQNWKVLRHMVPAMLVVGALICLPQAYEQTRKVSWSHLADVTAAMAGPETPLVFYQDSFPSDVYAPVLQAGVTRYDGLWKHPMLALTKTIDPETLQELRSFGRFLVVRGDGKRSPEEFIPGCVPTGRVATTWMVGDVSEYRFDDLHTTQTAVASGIANLTADKR